MEFKRAAYLFLSVIALVFIAALLYTLSAGTYLSAWICGVLAIVCMEGRTRLCGKLPRTAIFWIHISAAVPFFAALSTLAFFHQSQMLAVTAWAFLTITLATGGVLWYRGVRRTLSGEHTAPSGTSSA